MLNLLLREQLPTSPLVWAYQPRIQVSLRSRFGTLLSEAVRAPTAVR